MLKSACTLTGENYTLLSADTPASKKKVVALGVAMLIPTLIWLFNGFMLSFVVLKAGLFWAILTALVCGTIVFFIEKLIIMAQGNSWLTFFRVCIGLVIAVLGSLAIDEVVFKNDIDYSVANLKKDFITRERQDAGAEFNTSNNVSTLESGILKAQHEYDIAEKGAIAETDGTEGTKSKGVGDVAKYKDAKANGRKRDLEKLNSDMTLLNSKKAIAIDLAGNNAASTFNENALMIRVKGLFTLVSKDTYMLITYILFFSLMLFFEFLVVILKLTWKKTNYERRLEMIDEIGKERIEFLKGRQSPLKDPGNYLPQLQPSRDALKRKHSLYN